LICGLLLIALPLLVRRRTGALAIVAALAMLDGLPETSRADALVDEKLRAELLQRPDGQLARIETEYNDVFIIKRGRDVTMSFQLKGFNYTESVTNLRDPDALPVLYTRMMTMGVIYPPEVSDILMIGLGGGSISTYLGRAMKETRIDTVEIDPGVINAARKFFGIRDSARVKYFDGDGRVFLKRNSKSYDLILVDAFHGGYVPFHLLTREFYKLVKERLKPGGAAVFNVHDGTKLYASTLLTLGIIFKTVEFYPSGEGEAITVATDEILAPEALAQRAAALQEKHSYKYALPTLLARRDTDVASQTRKGVILSDDFAPVDLYDTIGGAAKKRN
jgi:spermidine synthase